MLTTVYWCTVAARLVAKSEVYCYGQRLPITGHTSVDLSPVSERQQLEDISDSSVPEFLVDHPSHERFETEPSFTAVALDAAEGNVGNRDDEFRVDLNTEGWPKDVMTSACPPRRHSVDFEQCVADCSKWSDSVELEPLSIDSPPFRRCLTWPDDKSDRELTETDDDHEILCDGSDDVENSNCDLTICKRAVAEQDNNETSTRPQKSQRRSELVHEHLPQNAKVKTTGSKCTWKINFFEEKLSLLEKMIAAGSVNFPCRMQVIMTENAVELVADEENVTESEIRLYELIANFSSISLHLPTGVVNLLQSRKGQRWLQTQLASLNAVFYAKDSACPFIIGADSKTSMDAKFLLETALSNKKIPFVDEHVIFLQSAQWAFAVQKFQSESFIVVNIEYGEKEIVLEGSVDALNIVSESIELMLKQNGRVKHKINMSAAQFQLLMHFRVEIQDKLRSETSQHQQSRYCQLQLTQVLVLP